MTPLGVNWPLPKMTPLDEPIDFTKGADDAKRVKVQSQRSPIKWRI